MTYEYLEHKADMGMRVSANSLEGVFQDAALGLCNIIYDVSTVSAHQSFELHAQAVTHEFLLVEFLNELISLMDRKDVFFASCDDITINEHGGTYEMRCVVHGEEQDREKHKVRTEVKATTYSGLSLLYVDNAYVFQCLFDV